jgi:uncharacterized ferritin-like protein (DUF455 family)
MSLISEFYTSRFEVPGMKQIQDIIEGCLFSSEVETKLDAMEQLAYILSVGGPLEDFKGEPQSTVAVLFPHKPEWVMPRQLKRRSMTDPEGLKVFLHAVAHIEFVAIHLALDAAYRFRDVPEAFRRDWLGVAVEEASHFKAVVARMAELSARYGDYPAHGGLWELAESTANDLMARMALIPRFMEARGLDVTPGMIEKFERQGDVKTVEVLSLILREEVGHVALGSHWFRWAADKQGIDPETAYFQLIERFLSGDVRGPFNVKARTQAGFTHTELDRLAALSNGLST